MYGRNFKQVNSTCWASSHTLNRFPVIVNFYSVVYFSKSVPVEHSATVSLQVLVYWPTRVRTPAVTSSWCRRLAARCCGPQRSWVFVRCTKTTTWSRFPTVTETTLKIQVGLRALMASEQTLHDKKKKPRDSNVAFMFVSFFFFFLPWMSVK